MGNFTTALTTPISDGLTSNLNNSIEEVEIDGAYLFEDGDFYLFENGNFYLFED